MPQNGWWRERERERERDRESFIIMEKKRRRDEESGYTEFGCIGFRV